MTDELKPCPFCGGEAYVEHLSYGDDVDWTGFPEGEWTSDHVREAERRGADVRFQVTCSHCAASATCVDRDTRKGGFQSRDQALAAWNTRFMEPVARGTMYITRERNRQIVEEGFSEDMDAFYQRGELLKAAVNYTAAAFLTTKLNGTAYSAEPPLQGMMGLSFPWDQAFWKPGTPRRMLEKAGALIAAELDRLDLVDRMNADDAAGETPDPEGGAS